MVKKNHDSDVSFIKELAKLLREQDLSELEVRRNYADNDNLNVRVARQIQNNVQSDTSILPSVKADERVTESKVLGDSPDKIDNLGAIPSPMVGTAYLAPEPGAKNFINIGQNVKEGDTLLIIEAMKTMNQIPSPKSGKISRIFVEDGNAVEFGTPLLTIE